jgi:hypothetical protein
MYTRKEISWKTGTLIGSNEREREKNSFDKKIMNVYKTIHICVVNC